MLKKTIQDHLKKLVICFNFIAKTIHISYAISYQT